MGIRIGAAWVMAAATGLAACGEEGGGGGMAAAPPAAQASSSPASSAPSPGASLADTGALEARLAEIARESDGTVGVAVIHVESGRAAEHEGTRPLALYSVFKLPLAIEALKQVEEGKLRLDQTMAVSPAESVPGSPENDALWKRPSNRTLREMIELAIARSDNTSSDVMLRLVGGSAVVSARMAALGFPGIQVRASVREFRGRRGEHPNTASAGDIARLLAGVQRGDVLRRSEQDVLLAAMRAATTGLQRLRGDLPPGTPVADKTGSGAPGTATNDAGLITLPGNRGHLAMAVLVSGSRRPLAAQEKLIARLARAAYDAHLE